MENIQQERRILKADGEFEVFSLDKFRQSLVSAGAPDGLVKQLGDSIEERAESFTSTDQIHDYAFQQLVEGYRPVADRYNLKRALTRFGPSGYPFEKYIAKLYEAEGYQTVINLNLEGACVSHEVDVSIENEQEKKMVEVKFHNSHGTTSGVQVALYVKSRFEDIVARQKQRGERQFDKAVIVTNTGFSSDATTYALCKGMEVVSWEGKGDALPKRIDRLGLHPITAMSLLSDKELTKLHEKGIVLCAQLETEQEELLKAGIEEERIGLLIREAKAISELKSVL